MAPVQAQVTKQLSSASLRVSDAMQQVTDPANKDQVSTTANQLFANMANWYTSKKEQWLGDTSVVEGSYESINSHLSKEDEQ